MKRRVLTVMITVIMAVFVVTGCKNDKTDDITVTMENYTGRSVDEYYESGEYQVILVNFWATFCAPCKKEMVDLEELSVKYKDRGVLVIGACTDPAENSGLIEKLLINLGVTYPTVYGLDSNFRGDEITGFPTTFILDSSLNIIERIDGKREKEYFDSILDNYAASLENSGQLHADPKLIMIDPYLTMEYRLLARGKDSSELEITVSPMDDYYLNGEGYPDLSISLSSEDTAITITPSILNCSGIKTGESESWQVAIDGITDTSEISAKLAIIACSKESCNMLNNTVPITL
jgi:thiol-disulfide isomerase/thioredoxin